MPSAPSKAGLRPLALAVVADNIPDFKSLFSALKVDGFSSVKLGGTPADFEPFLKNLPAEEEVVTLLFGSNSTAVLDSVVKSGRSSQWAHSLWTGVEKVNSIAKTLQEHDIKLSNVRDLYAPPLAEHVILSCLYFNRQIGRTLASTAAKKYDRFPVKALTGQKLGIVGYGNIGSTCGREAMKLGMQVTGLRHRPTSPGEKAPDGASLLSGAQGLEQILTESDFVVNVMPATEQNRGMFAKKQFESMRKDAVFVNIGRAHSIVEDDLADVLRKDVIKGAALDVFSVEPLPQTSPLWDIPPTKLLMTPHNADLVLSAFNEAAEQFNEAASKFIQSRKYPDYVVDFGRGY